MRNTPVSAVQDTVGPACRSSSTKGNSACGSPVSEAGAVAEGSTVPAALAVSVDDMAAAVSASIRTMAAAEVEVALAGSLRHKVC